MHRGPRPAPLFLPAVILALFLAACGGNGAETAGTEAADSPEADPAPAEDAGELTPVTVGFSLPAADIAGAYLWVGEALGYFEEEGLDVEIAMFGGSVETARQVATGAVDYAAGGTLEPVPQFNLQGDPLQAIHQYAYQPIFSMGIPEGSDHVDPGGLAGANIGVIAAGSGSVPVLHYLLDEHGLSADDVNIVPIGLGPQAVTAIEEGEVDAVMFHETAFVDFENAGLSFDYFSTEELDRGYASMGAYFNRERADELGDDTTESFLRALSKALLFTRTNPEAAVHAMGTIEPVVLEDFEASVEKLSTRVEIQEPPPEADGMIGWSDEANWERLQDVLIQGGVIDERADFEDLWSDEFLEAANDFDHDAVRQEAEDYEP